MPIEPPPILTSNKDNEDKSKDDLDQIIERDLAIAFGKVDESVENPPQTPPLENGGMGEPVLSSGWLAAKGKHDETNTLIPSEKPQDDMSAAKDRVF